MPIAGHENEIILHPELTEEERIVYEWHHEQDGSFHHLLMNAISKADDRNLENLRKGFPVHVSAYERYAHEHGWYDSVERRKGG